MTWKDTMDYPLAMITPSWGPMPMAPTLPQLQGAWEAARGLEPPIPDKVRMLVVLASAAVSAYHGTKRNGGSVFWGVLWFGLGAALPVLTPLVAVGQGLGECKNNCSTGRTAHLSGNRGNRR